MAVSFRPGFPKVPIEGMQSMTEACRTKDTDDAIAQLDAKIQLLRSCYDTGGQVTTLSQHVPVALGSSRLDRALAPVGVYGTRTSAAAVESE